MRGIRRRHGRAKLSARKLTLALAIADDYARAVERGEPSYAKVLHDELAQMGAVHRPDVKAVMSGEGKRRLSPVVHR